MLRGLLVLVAAILAVGQVPPAEALDLERRRMLTATEHVPWRGVGRVNVAGLRDRSMCTGTLVAEDLVITAAHCVISPRTGKVQPVNDVYFVAGWRRGQKVASRRAIEITTHPGYAYAQNPGFDEIGADLALIRLDAPIPVAQAPFFAVGDHMSVRVWKVARPSAYWRNASCMTATASFIVRTRPVTSLLMRSGMSLLRSLGSRNGLDRRGRIACAAQNPARSAPGIIAPQQTSRYPDR